MKQKTLNKIRKIAIKTNKSFYHVLVCTRIKIRLLDKNYKNISLFEVIETSNNKLVFQKKECDTIHTCKTNLNIKLI